MAGFTDMPFRELCTRYGAAYTETEMVSAAAVCYEDAKTADLCRISDTEAPCALQIFGHDPEIMREAAERLLSSYKGKKAPCAIDVNMGCPVRKIVTSGDGSALMRTPELAERITTALSDVTRKYKTELWVKIRAGWDANSINAPEFAQRMASAGAVRITVHGRTREMMYAPSSDNGVIRAVRAVLPDNVTVIGNGDIASLDDARRMIDETGCDGVAVGRAALGEPWIFSSLSTGDASASEKSTAERIEIALELIREVIRLRGEKNGIRESRGRAAHFIRSLPGAAAVRDRLNHAETYSEFERILKTLPDRSSVQ